MQERCLSILCGEPDKKKLLGKPPYKQENILKMDLNKPRAVLNCNPIA
jgi:hypothetical protein